MDLHRAKLALSAVARLHATFWRELWHAPPRAGHASGAGEMGPSGPGGRPRQGIRYAPGLHEQGTFWSLEKRDPSDLAGLEREFDKLTKEFLGLLPAAWFADPPEGVRDTGELALGRRLAARARALDAAAHGSREAGDLWRCGGAVRGGRGRSLIHGDLKTWNVFFARGIGDDGPARWHRRESREEGPAVGDGLVKFIDWQVGVSFSP